MIGQSAGVLESADYWGTFFLRFFFCWSFGTHLMVRPLSAKILMLAALASRTTSLTYRIKFCALWTNISWACAALSSDTSLASKKQFIYQFMVGWIPRNFKTLIFKPKLSFLMKNHKNDNYGWILGYFRIHPIYDFRDFSENGHFDNDFFREKY